MRELLVVAALLLAGCPDAATEEDRRSVAQRVADDHCTTFDVRTNRNGRQVTCRMLSCAWPSWANGAIVLLWCDPSEEKP